LCHADIYLILNFSSAMPSGRKIRKETNKKDPQKKTRQNRLAKETKKKRPIEEERDPQTVLYTC